MINYHALHRSHSYFEGWYFKHQNADSDIAFIPGVNFNELGEKNAFIQVITKEGSFHISYPYSEFRAWRYKVAVRIGKNIFTEKGMKIDIQNPEIECTGTVRYLSPTPIKSDIMGPFHLIPFMECNHGIISMKHDLTGSITLNKRKMDLSGGTGYIEKDWGTSFPSSYLWMQCNRFTDTSCSVMVSIAEIPFTGFHFQGCIAVVCFRGREYRFATYRGVQIVRCGETGFILKQGKYLLEAEIQPRPSQKLFAPKSGEMSRVIHESVSSSVRVRLFVDDIALFDLTSDEAGCEYVE
nr:tocopherol cyclase family protein [uncultured Caproiciproducens sp.]